MLCLDTRHLRSKYLKQLRCQGCATHMNLRHQRSPSSGHSGHPVTQSIVSQLAHCIRHIPTLLSSSSLLSRVMDTSIDKINCKGCPNNDYEIDDFGANYQMLKKIEDSNFCSLQILIFWWVRFSTLYSSVL